MIASVSPITAGSRTTGRSSFLAVKQSVISPERHLVLWLDFYSTPVLSDADRTTYIGHYGDSGGQLDSGRWRVRFPTHLVNLVLFGALGTIDLTFAAFALLSMRHLTAPAFYAEYDAVELDGGGLSSGGLGKLLTPHRPPLHHIRHCGYLRGV